MDWALTLFPIRDSFYQMMQNLSGFYRDHEAFWRYDYQAHERGFRWARIDGDANCCAFCRYGDEEEILVVNNFNDTDIFNLPLDLPENAIYELVFSSSILALFQLKLSALQLGGRGKYHDSTLDNLLSQTNKVRSLTRKILKQKNTSKYLVQ